ncbi:glycosyltransferase family protein [Phenylobacterium sp.]|uniref:glycosyltransferase family protein n=1 Tax=Phenylobacterium sp. TaxID=1871053 RepID=UPI002733B32A|nr:glycosyltransferase family protein [Phenylobacterium sp.]MDP3852501.1 glycosyltransferase family protein [Phenylobacterium sp.]
MILAVLQARMSSSRLPGKVMAPVLGQPMIARQVERLRRSRRVDHLVVATSEEPSDDPLATCAAGLDLDVVRGPLDDVLARFLKALDAFPEAETLVRLTADCPLTDWRVLDETIDKHLSTGADYTENMAVKTYPHGLDVEVMKAQALRRAGLEATSSYDREHVTPYLYATPGRFRLADITRTPSLGHLRWTVDLPEDLEFVRHVYETLYPGDPDFGTEAIAALPWNSSRAKA